jgi:uncharacterized protein
MHILPIYASVLVILFVHALGLSLLVGRFSHAFGVSQNNEDYRFRVAGTAMTFTTLLSAAGYLLIQFVRNAFA